MLVLDDVCIEADGRALLGGIDLTIQPGETHVGAEDPDEESDLSEALGREAYAWTDERIEQLRPALDEARDALRQTGLPDAALSTRVVPTLPAMTTHARWPLRTFFAGFMSRVLSFQSS